MTEVDREAIGGIIGRVAEREGLELVATRARYSLRELVGTLIALRHPQWRSRTNLLARERSLYCSAFVQHLFRNAGVELAPGVDGKNTTPEDISRTPVPHMTYLLERTVGRSKLTKLNLRLRRRRMPAFQSHIAPKIHT